MKPLKEKVSITLDSDVVAKIHELAEEDDRSFSQFINKVLKDYLNEKQCSNKIFIRKQLSENFRQLLLLYYLKRSKKLLFSSPTVVPSSILFFGLFVRVLSNSRSKSFCF